MKGEVLSDVTCSKKIFFFIILPRLDENDAL